MLRLFRFVALIEGITTIALFLVAMPMKYWLGNPALVPPVGMAHGVAWLAYVLGMLACFPGKGFTVWQWVRTFLVAFVPFGTFLNDPMIHRREKDLQGQASLKA